MWVRDRDRLRQRHRDRGTERDTETVEQRDGECEEVRRREREGVTSVWKKERDARAGEGQGKGKRLWIPGKPWAGKRATFLGSQVYCAEPRKSRKPTEIDRVTRLKTWLRSCCRCPPAVQIWARFLAARVPFLT